MSDELLANLFDYGEILILAAAAAWMVRRRLKARL
jgi:hypothetical protein